MKKVFVTGLVIAGLIAAWGCGKSEDSPANRGNKTAPTTEAPKAEQPAPPAAKATATATATVEVKAEAKPAVLPHVITDAEVGLKAKCPVMGTDITVDKNTLSAEYNGKVYYFCCAGCPEEFTKTPEKFATPAASTTPPAK
ncbi:MAG: YHS domain-containing protein [Candidatus Brocadiia bacterium]